MEHGNTLLSTKHISVTAVSYTHLDVYKRQVYIHCVTHNDMCKWLGNERGKFYKRNDNTRRN